MARRASGEVSSAALDEVPRQIGHPVAAELFHHLAQLPLEDLGRVIAPSVAERPDTVHERPPEKSEFGSAGQSPGDLWTGSWF